MQCNIATRRANALLQRASTRPSGRLDEAGRAWVSQARAPLTSRHCLNTCTSPCAAGRVPAPPLAAGRGSNRDLSRQEAGEGWSFMSESWQKEQRERNRDSRPPEPHTEPKFQKCHRSPSPSTSSESPFFVGENTQQPARIWKDAHELRERRSSSASTQGYVSFSIRGSEDASLMSQCQ